MAFDPRSLERLRELGRSLPSPLPKPEPPTARPRPSEARHKVETETDPEALFRELMQASPDGTVPPHLLARLKELESSRRTAVSAAGVDPAGARGNPGPNPGAISRIKPGKSRSPEELSLYAAFQQFLLEDEDA